MNATVSRILVVLKYLGRKLPIRQLRIKNYIGIAGVCMAVVGWLLSNADHFSLVYRIVAPKYSVAVSALNRMNDKDFVLKGGDDGFREISEILKEYFEATISREITQIRTVSRGVDTLETAGGTQWDEYIELEMSISDEPPITGKFYDLDSKIEQRYLINKLLDSKHGIFWIGIAACLVAVFL